MLQNDGENVADMPSCGEVAAACDNALEKCGEALKASEAVVAKQKEVIEAQQKELEEYKSSAWYKQPLFFVITGVASTLVIIAVGAPLFAP